MAGSAHDGFVVALSALTTLRHELDTLTSFVRTQSEDGLLPIHLAELPIKLKHAREQCKVVQRELSDSDTASRTTRTRVRQQQRYAARSIATQTWNAGFASPRPTSPRPAAPAAAPASSRPASPRASSTAAAPSDSGPVTSNSSRTPSVPTSTPRSISPAAIDSLHRRPLLAVSRWPENEVEPREARTPREQAIKDDPTHPLQIMYIKAPSHCDREPGPNELTAMFAKQGASTIRMMGGAARREHWLKLVFLEWVAVCVGSEERRQRKIGKVNKRRHEFFVHDPNGCSLHLNRAPSPPNPLRRGSSPDARKTPMSHSHEMFNGCGMLPSDVTPRGVSPARTKLAIPPLHL